MERVFYKVHDKISKLTLTKSTPKQRIIIENAILFMAVISFSVVILCHRTFVYRGGPVKSHLISTIPSVCLRNVIVGVDGGDFEDGIGGRSAAGTRGNNADITHLVIYDHEFKFGSSNISSCSCSSSSSCSDSENFDLEKMERKHYSSGQEGVLKNYDSNNYEAADDGQSCSSTYHDEWKNANGNDLSHSCSQGKDATCNNESNAYTSSNHDDADNNGFPNQSFAISVEPLTGKTQIVKKSKHTSKETSQHKSSIRTKNDISSCTSSTQQGQKHYQFQIYKSITAKNITYSFSSTKGYLSLPPETLHSRNISSQYIFISTNDKYCFSDDPLLYYLGNSKAYIGFRDTIALNWILGLWNGTNSWYILYHKNGMTIDLDEYLNEYSFRWPATTSRTTASIKTRWHHHFFIFKTFVLLSSLFLFFTTTTLVSFTLRETQDRMLRFTQQLQLLIRNRQPYGSLIVTHVIENMVFVPIMIGIIFFLTDCCYNGDKFLAFVILSGVWVCEVFSAISMRTIHSSIYYPQVFFAYFTLFHIYYFSCPFGFSYAALLSTVLFQLHSMVFFWNRYELPAILSGCISFETPRMGLHVYNNNSRSGSTYGSGEVPAASRQSNGSDDSSPSVVSSGHEIQRMRPSYPSMSSLGRISSYDGYPYW